MELNPGPRSHEATTVTTELKKERERKKVLTKVEQQRHKINTKSSGSRFYFNPSQSRSQDELDDPLRKLKEDFFRENLNLAPNFVRRQPLGSNED